MAEILITGATGLLGSSLVPALGADHDVVALARRPPDEPSETQARWVIHDLAQPELPADLPARVDVVVHLAQGDGFRDFPARALETYAVNVASTARLLDWAVRAGARQFVLASTGAVYANVSTPHREEDPVGPAALSGYYAASKLAGEALAQAYRTELAVVVLRPFFMYGRVQDRSMLLPRLADAIRDGRAVPLAGEDGMRFNPIHVSDATRAVVAALNLTGSAVVNLAGPEVLSLRQAAELLAARIGREVIFDRQPAATATDVIGDISTLGRLLGEPSTRLADVAGELATTPANEPAGREIRDLRL